MIAAAKENHEECVAELLRSGADVTLNDKVELSQQYCNVSVLFCEKFIYEKQCSQRVLFCLSFFGDLLFLKV